MRQFILPIAFILTFSVSVHAQKITPPIDSVSHKITYEGVVQTAGNKDQLYDKGLNWLAIAFKSSNDVIQIKDRENGKIVGKWSIQPDEIRLGFVDATITLLFKDGKYKYIITDLNYQGTSEFKPWELEEDPTIWKSSMTKGAQHKIKDNTYLQVVALINDLKKYMANGDKQNDF